MSGTNQILKCGIRRRGTAFAQIPVKTTLDSFKQINRDVGLVELDGISHLIVEKKDNPSVEEIKEMGIQLLEKYGLKEKYAACGVMFISKENNQIRLDPVVYVKSIDTLFYETACGSGTTAVGIFLLNKSKKLKSKYKILQPSGMCITVQVIRSRRQFEYAEIEGEVNIIS